MRVLSIHNRYKIGGGEDVSSSSEDQILREYGHEVQRMELDNAVIGDKPFGVAIQAVYNRDFYKRASKVIQKFAPQIVDVHNFFPLVSPSVYYACAEAGIPVVQTLHNYRLLCPSATFYRNGTVCEDCLGKPFAWPGILHACYRHSRAGSATVATMTAVHQAIGTWQKKVTLYVAVSEFARQKFIEGGFDANRIRVKPNFVHPDSGASAHWQMSAVFVGRLVPEKGIETMLRAWRKIGERVPLTIAGEGPLSELVSREAAQHPYIRYVGRLALPELYNLIGAAAFLVFPSEWYETFGRVAIEAFAKGTPVLLADLGAISELVDEGRTGWKFRAGDSDDLAARVEDILATADQLPRMRAEARREYEMKYTAEVNYQQNLAIFDAALALEAHRQPS